MFLRCVTISKVRHRLDDLEKANKGPKAGITVRHRLDDLEKSPDDQ